MTDRERSSQRAASFSAFAFSGAQSLTVAMYPLLAERLGLSISSLIASFSLGSLLFVFGSPYWAQRSDSQGRLPILAAGMGALLLSFFLLAALVWSPFVTSTSNLTILLASRLIYGLGASAIAPVAQALQADLSAAESATQTSTTRAMLLHTLSLNFGRVVGVSFVLFFVQQFENQMRLILPTFSIVIGAIFAYLIFQLLETGVERLPAARTSRIAWPNFSNVKWVFAVALLFSTFAEALNSSLGGTLKFAFALNTKQTSELAAQLMLFASLGIMSVQLATRSFPTLSLKVGLSFGTTCLILGSILFAALDSQRMLWLAMILFVIGAGLIPPLYLSLLRKDGPPNRYGSRAGWVGSAHTVGFALGGALSALIFRLGIPQTGGLLIFISVCLLLTCIQATAQLQVKATQ